MSGVFSPTRDDLQRWSQSFDQLMRSASTCVFVLLVTISVHSGLNGSGMTLVCVI